MFLKTWLISFLQQCRPVGQILLRPSGKQQGNDGRLSSQIDRQTDYSFSYLSIFLIAALISPTTSLSAPFLPAVLPSPQPSHLIKLPYLVSYSLLPSQFILFCSFLHQRANKTVLSTLLYTTLSLHHPYQYYPLNLTPFTSS